MLEEERFSRQKHTFKFPLLSLEAALVELKLGIGDIDVMTTPWDSNTSANRYVLLGLPPDRCALNTREMK